MAKFFTDFSEFSIGSGIPDFFTSRWASAASDLEYPATGIEGDTFTAYPPASDSTVYMLPNQLRLRAKNSYQRVGLEITAVAGSGSDEINVGLLNYETSSTTIANIILRGSGTTESTRSGYTLFSRFNSNNFEIRKFTSGSVVALARGTLPARVGRVAHRLRFSVVEQPDDTLLIRAWLWLDGEAEPATPFFSVTDGTPLPIGWAGIGQLSSSDQSVYYGYVGVGTDGDSAPTAAPIGAETPINPSITDLLATSARLNWEQG